MPSPAPTALCHSNLYRIPVSSAEDSNTSASTQAFKPAPAKPTPNAWFHPTTLRRRVAYLIFIAKATTVVMVACSTIAVVWGLQTRLLDAVDSVADSAVSAGRWVTWLAVARSAIGSCYTVFKWSAVVADPVPEPSTLLSLLYDAQQATLALVQ